MNNETKVKNIPIKDIRPNPYQPRKTYNYKSLEELSQSIKSLGLIQPISLREIKKDSYELIAGERRLRASEMAGLKEIPALILTYKDNEAAVIAIVENLQREDLNFIEEAEGYNNLILDHGFTQQEISDQVGKSQSSIANKLRILKLPDDIKRDLIDHNLTERHGRSLLKLPDEKFQRIVLDRVIKEGLNVGHTEDLVSETLDKIISPDDKKTTRKTKLKRQINPKIYVNTIKNAYKTIKKLGLNVEYEEVDRGDFIEVIVKIPKNL